MKKTIYTCLSALIILTFCAAKGNAQTISSYNNFGSCYGTGDSMTVNITGYVSGETLLAYFGDGTSSTYSPSFTSGGTGYFYFSHGYATGGSYTLEFVVVSATGVHLDSASYTYSYNLCEAMQVILYNDITGTCTYNSTTDGIIYFDPGTVEIDSAGVPVDTIVATAYEYYFASGPVGTVYTFKVITNPTNYLPCSVDSVNDTVNYGGYAPKYIGFVCNAAAGFDNAVFADAGDVAVHNAWQWAEVTSTQCTPGPLTLTVTFSPKYSVASVWAGGGYTYSVSGNILTVNLASVSSSSPTEVIINYNAVGSLTLGDTIHTNFVVTPISGDINPANNTEDFIDTIRSSYDPNDKSVQPEGNITAGTTLQYMVSFENTGNDTAHNIQVVDTLSPNVDVKSIQQIAASALVEMTTFTYGSQNIVEFSFPNINLLDSSHHGSCDGFVAFTVNSKTGLANGTKIDNSAGIYFDVNPVVTTNNVENVIGIPTSVAVMSNVSGVSVYPNPSHDEVTIDILNGKYNTATFTNVLGQEVVTTNLNATQTDVNVSRLSAGIYYITLTGESGVKVVKFEKL